jgi:aspartyl protease family protein
MLRLLGLTFGCVVAMLIAAKVLIAVPAKPAKATETPEIMEVASKSHPRANVDDTEVLRDVTGKFQIDAQINGNQAEFLIDTGADTVAISVAEAERLGVEIDRDSFVPIARTASGTGKGARIRIDQIEVAGQEFRDVDAIVIEGLSSNLLGQSLLRRLGKVEIQDDKLVIRRS